MSGQDDHHAAERNPALIAGALYMSIHPPWTFESALDFMIIHYLAARHADEPVTIDGAPADRDRPAPG